MSLSGLLRLPDVREAFSSEFLKPKIVMDTPLLAPRVAKHPGLVGSAFDYLLRFHLQRRFPKAIHRQWVAQRGLYTLLGPEVVDIDAGEIEKPAAGSIGAIATKVFDQANAVYTRYLNTGIVDTPVLKSALYLAQLDSVVRFKFIDPELGEAHPRDVLDLRKLISLVKEEDFVSTRRCWLNPTFGTMSVKIGGADADLILDDALIDIKVANKLEISREHFNQLLGYYVLHQLAALKDGRRKSRISKIDLYFARHAHLQMIDLNATVNPKIFPDFMRWFSNRISPPRKPKGRSGRR